MRDRSLAGLKFMSGNSHGDTAPARRQRRQGMVDGSPIQDGGQTMVPCRDCGTMVRFTTENGHLVAKDVTTWRSHPCPNP